MVFGRALRAVKMTKPIRPRPGSGGTGTTRTFSQTLSAAVRAVRSAVASLSAQIGANTAVSTTGLKYRYQQPYLFQTAPSEYITNRVPEWAGLSSSQNPPYDRRAYGPTAGSTLSGSLGGPYQLWPWSTRGGDWIDSGGVRYGGAGTALTAPAGLSVAINGGSGVTYTNQVCTAIVQQAYNNNRWLAMIWRCSSNSVFRNIYGKNSAFPPSMNVVYTDGTSETLACRITAQNNTSTDYVSFDAASFALPIFIEFNRPSKAVQSATVTFTIKDQFSGSCNLQGYLLDPPVNTAAATTGAASAVDLDAGLVGDPNVLVLHRYLDGTTFADFRYDPPVLPNFSSEAIFDPAIYGTGAQDLTKYPHVGAGKWIGLPNGLVTSPNGPTTQSGGAIKVDSTYTAHGFEPLAPGMGAIMLQLAAQYDSDGIALHDGSLVGDTVGSTILAEIFLPPNDFGNVDDLYLRQHVRIANCPTSSATRYQVHQSGTLAAPTEIDWTAKAGKWMAVLDHHCYGYGGGFSGTSGSTLGYQARMGWYIVDENDGGPMENAHNLDFHAFDFQSNPQGNYAGNYSYSTNKTIQSLQANGMGTLYYDKWYCVEYRFKLNTVLPYYPGFLADGELQFWVDDREIAHHVGLVFRQKPIFRGLGHAARATLFGVDQFSEITIAGLASGTGYVGAAVRSGDPAGSAGRSYYVLIVSRYSATQVVLGLAKRHYITNILVHLALTDPINAADGDVFRIEATGARPTVLAVFQNGVQQTLKWYTGATQFPAAPSTTLVTGATYSDAQDLLISSGQTLYSLDTNQQVGIFACNNTSGTGLRITAWTGGQIGGSSLTDAFLYADTDLNLANAAWVNYDAVGPIVVRSHTVHADPVHRADKVTNLLPCRELGHRNIMYNWFHGGQDRNPEDRFVFLSGIVASRARIGAMKIPATVPSWVPPAGEVALLTTTNGKLTNTFTGVCAPYYESFYFHDVRNDDSGAIINPYWGSYGAVICYGGGHAGNNDNSVVALEFGAASCTFKRLTSPSPNYGTATDSTTKFNNSKGSVARDPTYGEYTDGQPASCHSYGALDIIPPSYGGAANGTLFTAMNVAQGQAGGQDSIAAHKVDFANATGASGDYAWQRVTNSAVGDVTISQPIPCWTAFVPAQNRIYYEAKWSGRTPRWFNLTNLQYEIGTGTSRSNALLSSFYTGVMHHVPERDLLIFAAKEGGNVAIRYMRVAAADTNPSWAGPATLSQTLPVGDGFSSCCWCPDNSRLIAFGVTGDYGAAYEIQIPTVLTDVWTVTRAPFGTGQTITEPNSSGSAPGSPAYKSWNYNSKTKSIVYFPLAATSGSDTVYVYRPRNT